MGYQHLSQQQRDDWDRIDMERDATARVIAGCLADGEPVSEGLLDNFRRLNAASEAYYALMFPKTPRGVRLREVS
jgi:hypothetical protein